MLLGESISIYLRGATSVSKLRLQGLDMTNLLHDEDFVCMSTEGR